MKNIVLLKNLPSNIIEEAIVIVKNNKDAKRLEYVDKINSKKAEKDGDRKDYIIKEAEDVIKDYMEIMKNNEETNKKANYNKRHKGLIIYSVFVSLLLLISIIV